MNIPEQISTDSFPYRKPQNDGTWLVFKGLDTFVEIKLCNKLVANVANQYRQFIFEVSDILSHCSKDPVLTLNFGPASLIVHELSKTGPGNLA